MVILQLSACSLTAHTPPENIQHEGYGNFSFHFQNLISFLGFKRLSNSIPLSVEEVPIHAISLWCLGNETDSEILTLIAVRCSVGHRRRRCCRRRSRRPENR